MVPGPSAVDFEWTVRFGDLLTMAGAILVAFSVIYRRGREESHTDDSVNRALTELKDIKDQIEKMNEKLSKVDTINMQVTLLMKWYDELRRGIGFVPARIPANKSVDDEY